MHQSSHFRRVDIPKLKETVILDAKEGCSLSSTSLSNLNVSLDEFVEPYRKANWDRVTPYSMETYLHSINRWLGDILGLKINITRDKVFTNTQSGYLTVVD